MKTAGSVQSQSPLQAISKEKTGSDEQYSRSRSTSIRASPSAIAAAQFNQSANDTQTIGRGSPIGASSDATGESGDDNRRPSPQLLFAFNGTNGGTPPASAPIVPQMPPAASSNRFSPTVMSSRSTFLPHSPNVAGRLPPSLALEKPALRDSETSAHVQRRSRSSSTASNSALAQAQALQFIRRGDTSMASADGDDEYAEELQLIPSSTRKPGVALRNRSMSSASASPSLLPQSLLQEQASCGTTSRVLVVCASGILFMVLLAFCTVIGLRMAAHVKYDNSLCMARFTNEHHSSDPEVRRTVAAQMDRDFGFTTDWTPNYDYSSWDKQWFEEKARLYFLSTQEAASFAQPSANANNPDAAAAADASRGRSKPISKGESQMETRIQQLWQAGVGLEHLRLNHFKTFGSHNSYHKASSLPLSMHQYSHATLPEQLQTYRSGLRQLELDVHIIRSNEESTKSTPDSPTSTSKDSSAPTSDASSSSDSSAAQVLPGAMVIYHLQWIDDRTSCYCLSECLELINDWSATHPSHFPIFLFYEIKSQMWEDIDTGLKGVSCEDVERIEQEILQTFPRDRLILPIDVRGGIHSSYTTVQQALNAAGKLEENLRRDEAQRLKNGQPLLSASKYPSFNFGWPTLKASIGKIIVVWLDDMHSLADRLDCVIAPVTGAAAVVSPPTLNDGDKSTVDPAPSSTGAAEPVSDSTSSPDPTPSTNTHTTIRLNPEWYHSPERISFIAQNSMDKSYASIITQNKPQMATRAGTIVHAIAHGYLVRTMTLESSDVVPDPARFNAALHSGAHIISTDFEDCQARSTFHSPETSPGLGIGVVDDSTLGGNSKAATTTGSSNFNTAPPSTSDPSAVLGSDLEGSADQAVHSAAASHAASAHSLDTVLPSVLPGQLNNSTAQVYCEHLPDRWPFGCNQLSAPSFCESALAALRMHLAFAEMAVEKDNGSN